VSTEVVSLLVGLYEVEMLSESEGSGVIICRCYNHTSNHCNHCLVVIIVIIVIIVIFEIIVIIDILYYILVECRYKQMGFKRFK